MHSYPNYYIIFSDHVTYGTAEPLSVASVTRARQITASTLYKRMNEAYVEHCEQVDGQSCEAQSYEELSFEDWCEKRKVDSPQFQSRDTCQTVKRCVCIQV